MNRIFLRFTFLLSFVCLISIVPTYAQSIQNISSVNVDNLSDQQINQLLQQAQSAGLTDDQLVQQAQSRGMSAVQAIKLQNRIKDIRANANKSTDTTQIANRTLNYTPDKADTSSRQIDHKKDNSLPVFGADLFKNNNIRFEPNLNIATPVNYILGPSDQVNISVNGNSTVTWKLNVSPEGNINIPGVGLLNVAGKTIERATSDIKGKLAANNYAVGRGTTVDVGLGNIRSIKVIMVGQLVKPGTYTLPSLATVFNALYLAGGPNANGSYRQIEIIRNNSILRRLDVYDFLVKGDQKNNITLQDQDIIRVPTYRTRVELAGQVKVPAQFEVLPGETLKDVLNFAGGFTDSAYTARITVSQISDQQRRLTDVIESDYQNYIPLRGDKYLVQSIINRFENRVTINGAVFRPGEYQLDNGLTLLQLIKKAAGIREDAFTGNGSISRLKPDNSTEQISFNLQNIINKTANDIPLQREDVINISSIFDLRDFYTVSIKGDVRKGGRFAYADSMTIQDLIIKAGGFAEGASSKRIEVARRVSDSDPSSKNSTVAMVYSVNVDAQLRETDAAFRLKPFDIVSVYTLPGYEKQKTVKVDGEVIYPGYYTIKKKDEKISDIVARAGGLTASADAEGGTLRRDNFAILGVDKSKIDTTALLLDKANQANRIKRTYKDSSNVDNTQLRNNYVGIDLVNILKLQGSKEDLLVEDGDVLRVPKQQQIVRVNGQVLYPSAVVYNRSKTFNDFVLNAGGYGPDALRRGAYVVYPNGTVKGTRKFLFFNSHPSVKPGSEIYVPTKPVQKGNSLQTIIGLTTGLASIGAIILGIVSLHK